jgi:hypothetical protein
MAAQLQVGKRSMNLSDEELTVYAIREAQLILADYVQPGPTDAEKTVQELLEVLDSNDVVEADDRLEDSTGTGVK